MDYKFVVLREAGWAAFVAVSIVILQALVAFDPEQIGDFRTWVVGLGAGGIKAGAAAILAAFTKGFIIKEPSPANPGG